MGADVNGDDGLEVAGRSHGLGDIASGDFDGLELRGLVRFCSEVVPCTVAAAGDEQGEKDKAAGTFRFSHESKGGV